jgi:hypothetical protein
MAFTQCGLLQFHKLPNPAPWQVFDITDMTDGTLIRGVPAVLRNSAGVDDVYIRSFCPGPVT